MHQTDPIFKKTLSCSRGVSKSTPDQQGGRSGEGGTITGITQKAFLPANNGTDADATASDGKNINSKILQISRTEEVGKEAPSLVSRRKRSYQRTLILWEERTTLWIALIMIGGTIIFCCLGGFLCNILNRQRRRDGQRRQFKHVFGYLNKMDIDDWI